MEALSVGKRIKNKRREKGITQLQIQEQTSISSGNLSCIENGKYLPSSSALLELSKILGCSMEWLLTGEQPIENNNANKETSDIEDSLEIKLIDLFRYMSEDDKLELLAIAQIKAQKQNKKMANFSYLGEDGISSDIS